MFPSFFKFIITLLLFTSFFYNVNSLKCPKRHYRGKQEKFVVILKDNPSLNSRSLNSRRRDHFNKMSRCLNKTTIPTIPFHDDTNKLDNEKDVLQDFNVENVITGYVGYFDPNFVKDELKDWDDVDVVEKEKTFKVTSWKRKLSKRSSNDIVQQSTTLWVSRVSCVCNLCNSCNSSNILYHL